MSGTNQSRTLIIAGLLLASSLGGAYLGYRFAESNIPADLRAIISEREAELGEIRERMNGLEEELEEQLTINSEISEDYASMREELESLQAWNAQLERELQRLQSSMKWSGPLYLPFQAPTTQAFLSYVPSEKNLTLSAPQYQLPLMANEIGNYDQLNEELALSDEALNTLLTNGFVVVEYPYECQDFEEAYRWVSNRDIPVFITSDTLLHVYHIQFDETLKSVEERVFFDYIWNISEALYEYNFVRVNYTEATAREAHIRNAAYYAVALMLLKPSESQVGTPDPEISTDRGDFVEEDLEIYAFEVPELLESMVEAELELIDWHGGFSASPIFIYPEDYSQYVPRGHYTSTEKLKNYFRALMWFGRLSMLLRGDPDLQPGQYNPFLDEKKAIISEYDAEVQTKQACITAALLAGNPELWEKWNHVYEVTSFYVGFSDDLGPLEYLEAMRTVFGSSYDPSAMTSEEYTSLKVELAEYRPPAIYGGTGAQIPVGPVTPETLDDILEATKGFRMMGQRFVPDSYMFQELVYPRVGYYLGTGDPFTKMGAIRGFPRGLDAMAVLGSDRARALLDAYDDTNYANYDEQFERMEAEFNNLTVEEWNRNLYWSWLYALKPLLGTYGEGYPAFMRTEAWGDKQLTAALASWTELRHDTILYAKQSYTALMGLPFYEPFMGYVEPVPEFYTRLLGLTEMTREGLGNLEVLDESSESRLTWLENALGRLIEISEKELAGDPLTSDDYQYIQGFEQLIKGVTRGLNEHETRSTLVADVHTEPNSGMVLEEGTGGLRLLIAAVKHPTGETVLAAGPVMTYYEFKQPMDDRLTDEAWREMLKENPPSDPEWTDSYTE
jgi:hypothetical protein